MELEPTLDELMKHVDSKYTMVVAAAKRARQIMDGSPSAVDPRCKKPVSIALEELAAGRLRYQRTKHGIK